MRNPDFERATVPAIPLPKGMGSASSAALNRASSNPIQVFIIMLIWNHMLRDLPVYLSQQ